jgi:hypothetical protein
VGLFVFSIILGPIAIYFGVRARRTTPSGAATAGLVLGVIDVVLFLIVLGAIGAHRAYL